MEITRLLIDEEFVTDRLSMSVISEQLLELLNIFMVNHLHNWVFVFSMVSPKSIEAVLVSPEVNPWITELRMISFIYPSFKFFFIELQMHTPLRQGLLPHALRPQIGFDFSLCVSDSWVERPLFYLSLHLELW